MDHRLPQCERRRQTKGIRGISTLKYDTYEKCIYHDEKDQ